MALIVKDRVKETTTTTGTGTITLAGAVDGFQAFSVIGNGNTTYYCITDGSGNNAWEVGIGTYTLSGTTLARTTILSSSNSGNAITLGTGTHNVFTTYGAERSSFATEGLRLPFTASGAITAGSPVARNSDGTMQDIATTTSTTTKNGNFGSPSNFQFQKGMAYNEDNGDIVVGFDDPDNSTYWTGVVVQTASNGDITVGSRYVFTSDDQYGYGDLICRHKSSGSGNGTDFDGYFEVHKDYSNWLTYGHFTVSGTVITVGGSRQNIANYSNTLTTGWTASNPHNNTMNVLFNHNQNQSQVKFSSVNPSGTGFTNQDDFVVTNSAGSTGYVQMCYVPTTYNCHIFYSDSNQYTVEAYAKENGSQYMNGGYTTSAWYTSGVNSPNCSYWDSNIERVVLFYGTNGNAIRAIHFTSTTSGGSTSSNDTELITGVSGAYYDTKQSKCSFDSTNNKGYYCYNDAGGASGNIKLAEINSNTASISVDSTTTLIASGTYTGINSYPNYVYNSFRQMHSPVFRTWNSSYVYVTRAFSISTSTSTNVANYYGIAQNTVADGETVYVNVEGSISEQSGLTPLSKYYVQDNGDLSTTSSDYYAGKALSATQLLMNQDSGGGSGLTLTLASGESVTAGDAVGVNSSGEAQKAISATSSTLTSGTAVRAFGTTQTGNNGYGDHVGAYTGNIYICEQSQYSYPKLICATLASDGTLTFGSAISLSDSSGGSAVVELKNYNGDNVVLWSIMDEQTKYYAYSVSGTTLTQQNTTTLDNVYQGSDSYLMQSGLMKGSATNVSGWGSGPSGEYDAGYVVYTKGSAWADCGIFCRSVYFGSSSNSGYTIQFGSEYTIRSGYGWTSYPPAGSIASGNVAVWNETDQQLVVSMRTSGFTGGSVNVKSYKQNSSSAGNGLTAVDSGNGALDLTASSGTNGRSAETSYFDMTWHKQDNKIVCFGVRDGSESNNPYGNVGWTINCESNTYPSIAKSDAIATMPTILNDAKWFRCVYSDTSKEIYCIQSYDADSGTSDDALYFQAVTLSGNDITMGDWSVKAVSGSDLHTDFANYASCSNLIVNPTTNLCVLQYYDNSSSNYYSSVKAFGYQFVDASGGFIGVSQTSASSGDITVNVIGQTDANQTGLTPGSKVYYDSSAGGFTATSTNNTEVGLALSATQFLFNKQP